MGSFRSLNTRQQGDTAQLTEGLGDTEWIRYWKRLPHSAAQAIANVAAKPDIDRHGRVLGVEFNAGKAAAKRLELGIVDWHILDENGNDVPWIPAQAEALLDGLDPAVVDALSKVIGQGDPKPGLDEVVNDGEGPEGELVGEDFAVSSSR